MTIDSIEARVVQAALLDAPVPAIVVDEGLEAAAWSALAWYSRMCITPTPSPRHVARTYSLGAVVRVRRAVEAGPACLRLSGFALVPRVFAALVVVTSKEECR